MFETIISAEQLMSLMTSNQKLWIADMRYALSDTSWGRHEYEKGHIEGAHYLHLDEDLSATKTGKNGRHPLPAKADFINILRQRGFDLNDPTLQVIIYDQDQAMMAARLWWMFRWIGHRAVSVVDGGYAAWLAAGYSVDTAMPNINKPSDINTPPHPPAIEATVVSVEWVEKHLDDAHYMLVDARARPRYLGEVEPMDKVAGHIPHALNRPFTDNLQANNQFKSPELLRQEWQALIGDKNACQIVHQCGSGVTACHNILSMERAGLSGSALYAGSWSEWCADERRPMVRGNPTA